MRKERKAKTGGQEKDQDHLGQPPPIVSNFFYFLSKTGAPSLGELMLCHRLWEWWMARPVHTYIFTYECCQGDLMYARQLDDMLGQWTLGLPDSWGYQGLRECRLGRFPKLGTLGIRMCMFVSYYQDARSINFTHRTPMKHFETSTCIILQYFFLCLLSLIHNRVTPCISSLFHFKSACQFEIVLPDYQE